MQIHIETKRLVLRHFEEPDAAACVFNSTQPRVANAMSDMVLKTEEKAVGWIKWIRSKNEITDGLFTVLAIERKSDGKCIGLMGFIPQQKIENEIEILYSVGDPYQGCGYATEAAKAIVWWAFEKQGLAMLSAIIKPVNKESQRVIEKLGFEYLDTRELPYNGKITTFHYYRLCRSFSIPNPDWDFTEKLEKMGAFFDKRADGYEAHMLTAFGAESYEKGICAIPKNNKPLKVLDLGCGTGLELKFLFERLPGAQVTCLDLSEKMLSVLKENYRDRAEQLTVICGSYLTWGFPLDEYDIVISFNSLHHFVEEVKEGIYRNIRSCLKSAGLYVEADFIVDENMAEKYMQRYLRLKESTFSGQYHIDIPFTVEVQRELLQRAGFTSVEVYHADIKQEGSYAVLTAEK